VGKSGGLAYLDAADFVLVKQVPSRVGRHRMESFIDGPIPATPASIASARVVGATLTATPGNYFNITAPGLVVAPIWQYFDGTTWNDITGATGTTLVLPAEAISGNIRYLETATLNGVVQPTPSNEIDPIGGPELVSAPVAAQSGGDVTVSTPAIFGVTEGMTGVEVPQTGRWQVQAPGPSWEDPGVSTPQLPTAGEPKVDVILTATGLTVMTDASMVGGSLRYVEDEPDREAQATVAGKSATPRGY